ncbi:helix-turn-helix domain-containing protein [Marinitoga sp. 1155]|uniref:helix-turn-helix domain-containing protein n=1 Tax=Marinitoga sp. 1155 TaxID=1428448 RepID=UPI00069B4447|nr:helix-turn-helix transcriptional regulator [Marinitoga sp. 1155]
MNKNMENDIIRKIKEGKLEKFELKSESLEEELENIIIDLVSKLTLMRMEQGVSQKELAEKIGTKQTAISRLENASSNPSLKFLLKITKALGGEMKITPHGKYTYTIPENYRETFEKIAKSEGKTIQEKIDALISMEIMNFSYKKIKVEFKNFNRKSNRKSKNNENAFKAA